MYFGSWTYKGQVDEIHNDPYKHDKHQAVVYGIPNGTNWESAVNSMVSPDVLDGYVTDHSLDSYWNQQGIAAWKIVYSIGKETNLHFGPWSYQQNHFRDDGYLHSKYQSVLYGIKPGDDWDVMAKWAINNILPKDLDGKTIDTRYTSTWNESGISMYVIVYTTTDYTTAGMSFNKWNIDGVTEESGTGIQRKKYYSQIMNVPVGVSWADAGNLMLKFVPKDINGDIITKTHYEDKGVLGLFVVAEGTPKFGWSLATWGLKAGTSDTYQAQVLGLTRAWETFNTSSVKLLKDKGLLSNTVDNRKVVGDYTYFQSAFGVFIEVNVEPGLPWYVVPLVITVGVVGTVVVINNKTKGSDKGITIVNKK